MSGIEATTALRSAGLCVATVILLSGCHKPGPPATGDTPEQLAALLAGIDDPGASTLTPEQASRFVALSLHCVDREYPNKPGHVYDGAETVRPPRAWTPAFFGCFDWHSAVHGHWAMARLLRVVPALPEAVTVSEVLDRHLSPQNLEQELAFFRLERSRLFERPYGWAWLLRLHAELRASEGPEAARRAQAVAPLAAWLSQQMQAYLARLTVPIRAGTHANTAFAMSHMLDAARTTADTALEQALVARARDFFSADVACPTAYEPSGEDFISPCLAEADLMRRVLQPPVFATWLTAFLPPLTSPQFRPLIKPVEVKDRHDPRIGHLIGLALQRAWCFAGIAAALPADDPRRPVFERLGRVHRQDGLRQMFDSGYGGAHWLASFAVYLLTGAGG